MAPRSHRRQVLLFFAAVLLPCVALLALGLRLVVQERELARARLEDEQRRVIRQVHRDLAARLERTALRQVTALSANPDLLHTRVYDDSAIVLVARVSNGQLILPWEQVEQARDFRALLEQGEFGERLRRGEQAEFASENPGSAVGQYRQALGAADHSVQEAHARLYLARALDKAGQQGNATTEYRRLATLAPEVVDDNGIPFSLYASRQLLRSDPVEPGVRDAIQSVLSTDHWLPPGAVYLLRDLADTLLTRAPDPSDREAASELVKDVAERVALTEQALALKGDFPSLGIRIPNTNSGNPDTRWVSYGDPPWLVGAPPVGDRADGLVVAIHSAYVLSSVEEDVNAAEDEVGKVSIIREGGQEEEVLGASFPGLFVQFAPLDGGAEDQVWSVRWWFYSVGLLLVFGVTLFGAYLLWRDVRREVQLAETRSRFVAAVSHELKTPLTAIRMFAETLHESESQGRDTQREYLETIVNESERLTRLLNNVLDFSKIEGGRKTYHLEPQSLQEIVRFTSRAMQYPLEQKRFDLHLEIDDDVPLARVDRDAIEQALLNLLANAMKYSGESRDIDLRLKSEDGDAVIEVSDRGVGIEPSELSNIFERFYRVSSLENDRIPGAGLGLTLVQHIAEAHGGRVEVKSQPGIGSTFSLRLPLDRAESKDMAEPTNGAEA